MNWDIPTTLSIEQIIEVRDGLKSGQIRLELADGIEMTDSVRDWMVLCTAQLIQAYDEILKRRTS